MSNTIPQATSNNNPIPALLEDTVLECKKAFDMWSGMNELGAMDPHHEDGYLLNMLREQILALQQRITRICNAKKLEKPEIALKPLPPVMDINYMVRESEYTKKADGLMEEMLSSPIYKMYLEMNQNLSMRGKEKLDPFTCVINMLVNGIESKSPFMLQQALLNGLLAAGSKMPLGAGPFLGRLGLILENMGEDDFDDQMTLF